MRDDPELEDAVNEVVILHGGTPTENEIAALLPVHLVSDFWKSRLGRPARRRMEEVE